jgi:hypothetical protein
MNAPDDDLFALLGVTLPERKAKPPVECGDKPPKVKPVRFTEWNNDTSFRDAGYLARVLRTTCKLCEGVTETLEGIFHVEVHTKSNTRRLQAVLDWPTGEYSLEIVPQESAICAGCVRQLGFSDEREAQKHPYSLIVKE